MTEDVLDLDEQKKLLEWEQYTKNVCRLKVEGGHIYSIYGPNTDSCVFVPDIDLTRYQSHLRDAYNSGFKDGQANPENPVICQDK